MEDDKQLPRLSSLDELIIDLPNDIRSHLQDQYKYEQGGGKEHLLRVLKAMKLPPKTTTCRVNQIVSGVDAVLSELNDFLALQNPDSIEGQCTSETSRLLFHAKKHDILQDVIEINTAPCYTDATPLSKYCSAPKEICHGDQLRSDLTLREKQKFPLHYKVIVCDRLCGEAVLRGSDIFLKGVLVADKGIIPGDYVCVYAHLDKSSARRGMYVSNYTGHCVFLGIGQANCYRAEIFNQSKGIAITMLNGIIDSKEHKITTRAGALSPALNGIMTDKMMLQNLPSSLVAHILDPKPKDIIVDLCCAPGGKTTHIANLVNNDATIIAMDKSKKKVKAARLFFKNMKATCIVPIALDSTKCVRSDGKWMSVNEILSSVSPSDSDELIHIKGFYPKSFDKIVLDPPCSALGLRPKLCIDIKSLDDLNKHAQYQRRFVDCAFSLLKPGGTLVYSTCTINSDENERMVRYILDHFKEMKLVPISINIGLPGLQGCGLSDKERGMVLRFDPSNVADTMGFFIAKFQKVEEANDTNDNTD